MPVIFFYGPDLEKEKKEELINSFTKQASEITGIEEKHFLVFLRSTTPEDVGIGGELLEDYLNRED